MAGGPSARRFRAALTLGLLLACGSASCARRDDSLIASSDSTHVHAAPGYENPAAIPHPSPPQPRGPQVGKRDRVLNAAAPQLEEWAAMWRAVLPGFRMDSTWSAGVQRWTPAWRMADQDFGGADSGELTAQLLSARSPSGRYDLNVDWYQVIVPSEDTLEVGGEPDSQPLLVDRSESRQSPLQFCGTGCGFHWGRWLSPTMFALGGWQDADDYSQWKQGSLLIYSLRDSTVRRYETRIVSAADYARYEAAWKRWLLKRYRGLPARHEPT